METGTEPSPHDAPRWHAGPHAPSCSGGNAKRNADLGRATPDDAASLDGAILEVELELLRNTQGVADHQARTVGREIADRAVGIRHELRRPDRAAFQHAAARGVAAFGCDLLHGRRLDRSR